MSDYTDLKAAATYAAQDVIKFSDESEEIRALQQFHEEVDPETVLALIAENERLFKLLERTVEQYVPLTELEGVPGWSRVVELVEVVAQRDRLRAEVAGLKTGYEAYERVNAELKAENETLIAAAQALRDEWRKDQVDAGRHRFARDCAYGALTLMEGKRVFVELDYPSGEFSGCDQAYDAAIDAALGQGEQS